MGYRLNLFSPDCDFQLFGGCLGMSTVKHFSLIFATLAAIALPVQATAQEAILTVLPGWRADDGTHIAALRIDLEPGWQTYWRTPGDVGIPPRFDWGRSKNLAAATVSWPRPSIFESYGARTIGYKDHVVLPVTVVPRRTGKKITFAGTIEIGVCNEICIPTQLPFRAVLSPDGRYDAAIANALAQVPGSVTNAIDLALGCLVDPISDGLRIKANVSLPALGGDEAAVMEYADATVWVSDAEVTRTRGNLTVAADFVAPNGKPFAVNRSQITITLFGERRALEIAGCPAPS